MPSSVITLIIVAGSMFALFIIISTVGNHYSLNQIKQSDKGNTAQLVGRPKRKSKKHTNELIFSLTSGEIIQTADQVNKV